MQRLNDVINRFSLENNQKYIGKIEKVLLLGESEKDNSKLYGYTETMKLVNVITKKEDVGKIIDVEITDAKSFSLDGKAI